MNPVSHIILIDPDMRRRASISRSLIASGIHVEPLESIAELAVSWPRQGVILLHDGAHAVTELVARMAEHGEWFPIIAFNETPSPDRVVKAVLDGAIDYIQWPSAPTELGDTLRRSLERSGKTASAKMREVMARTRVDRLTRREREVLNGVASGLSNRRIGEQLAISSRTVEIHRANMLTKLGANHTSEAIRIAIEASMAM